MTIKGLSNKGSYCRSVRLKCPQKSTFSTAYFVKKSTKANLLT